MRDWNGFGLDEEARNKGEKNEEEGTEVEERKEQCNKRTCLHAAKGDMDRVVGIAAGKK